MASWSRIACLLVGSAAAVACAGRNLDVGDDGDGEPTLDGGVVVDQDAGDAAAHPHHGHTPPPVVEASAPLPPSCDEDNPVRGDVFGIDKPLPPAVLQFQRQYSWGCVHREWHETRVWGQLHEDPERFATRLAYVQKMKWTKAAVQEGQPGNGLDFLSMHRAMLGTLRARFPEHARLFAGWTTPPTVATAEDPLAPGEGDAGAPAFSNNMLNALDRINRSLATFASDDDFGIWVQSQIRTTNDDPFARSPDPTAGLHTYYHVRLDDRRSAIRMQRFNRNIENQAFFRLHGWLDGVWTKYRAAKGFVDAQDATYTAAMKHACEHMGFPRGWDAAKQSCVL